jgi:hypothetical protein
MFRARTQRQSVKYVPENPKMKKRTKITLRTKIYLTIVALLASAGLFYAASGVPFAVDPQPISVAAAPNQLVVSTFCSGALAKVSDTAVVTPFATIPGPNIGCDAECGKISPARQAQSP